MSASGHVLKRLMDLLEEKRMVVWYDDRRAFQEIARSFTVLGCRVVNVGESALRARREAEAIACRHNDARYSAEKGGSLLVFAPRGRGQGEEEQAQDPFEALALQGAAFGHSEGEKLQSLARQAIHHHPTEFDRPFGAGRPTLAILDGLERGARYPLLREALGTGSAAEARKIAERDA